jgi:hypothetical protein
MLYLAYPTERPEDGIRVEPKFCESGIPSETSLLIPSGYVNLLKRGLGGTCGGIGFKRGLGGTWCRGLGSGLRTIS